MNESSTSSSWTPAHFNDVVVPVSTKPFRSSSCEETRCINLEDISQGAGRISGWTLASENLSTKTAFKAGDILFGKLRPYLRKYAIAPFDGVCTTEILVFRAAQGVDPRFAFQVAASDGFVQHNVSASFGTKMPRTNWRTASSYPLSLPPRLAQRDIAEVLCALDAQVAEVETCLSKQAAIREGLVSDLLAQHVDAPREPLAKLAAIGSGVTLGRKFVGPGTADYPYLRVANVQDGHVDLTEVKTLRLPQSVAARAMLEPGDVLMNEGGDFDKLGRGAVWRGQIANCLHQNHVFRVRCNQALLLPDFLALWAASEFGKKFFMLASKQSTNLASINSTQLKKFPVLRPSPDEQREVLKAVVAIDSVLELDRAELAGLRLLKQGLARDLLTGKVRVPS